MRVERVIVNEKQSIRKILEALDNNLTLEDNFQLVSVEVITPTQMDREFAIQHLLGRRPLTFIATMDAPGVVYGSRREAWDRDTMYLKSSASNARVYLIVL
jgi:hypothetical protein